MRRNTGWRYESARHSLAARGVKTGSSAIESVAGLPPLDPVPAPDIDVLSPDVSHTGEVVSSSRFKDSAKAVGSASLYGAKQLGKTLALGFGFGDIDHGSSDIDEKKHIIVEDAVARKEAADELAERFHEPLPPLPELSPVPLPKLPGDGFSASHYKSEVKRRLVLEEEKRRLRREAEDDAYFATREKSLTDPTKPLPSLLAKGRYRLYVRPEGDAGFVRTSKTFRSKRAGTTFANLETVAGMGEEYAIVKEGRKTT